jgi:hypothetical protein
VAATIKFDARAIEKKLAELPGVMRSRVAVRALNKSAASANTAMVRVIAKDLGVKQEFVRDRLSVTEARPDRLVAVLRANAKRLPVMAFGAKQTGTGVSAKTPARKYPGAFIATMPTGHQGVFTRTSQSRSRKGMPWGSPQLPIRELFGPSIALVFKKYEQVGIDRAKEQLIKNISSELRYALQQLAK